MSEQGKRVAVVCAAFDDSGEDAILAGLRWLAEGGSDRVLQVMHVVDPSDVKESVVKPALVAKEEALAQGPWLIAEWIRLLSEEHKLPFDARIGTHVRIGKAVDTVLQFAVDYDADMLIAGTNARRGLDRMLLGSVAEKLVRNAHCPVLVARPKDYSGLEKTPLPDAPYPAGQEPHYKSPEELRYYFQSASDVWRQTGGRPTGFRIV